MNPLFIKLLLAALVFPLFDGSRPTMGAILWFLTNSVHPWKISLTSTVNLVSKPFCFSPISWYVMHFLFVFPADRNTTTPQISRITYIHACGFIHGDVEPGNFLMGIGPRSNEVNVIDFGCSRRFMDAKTHVHIPYEESKKQGKNALFASISTQSGVVPTRRDDLESLAYVLIYFLRGALPWQNLRDATHKQTYHRILESKKTVSTDVVCRGLPNEFGTFLNHSRALRFDENPNYAYLHQIFRELFTREGYQYDYNFDWSPRINVSFTGSLTLHGPDSGKNIVEIRSEQLVSCVSDVLRMVDMTSVRRHAGTGRCRWLLGCWRCHQAMLHLRRVCYQKCLCCGLTEPWVHSREEVQEFVETSKERPVSSGPKSAQNYWKSQPFGQVSRIWVYLLHELACCLYNNTDSPWQGQIRERMLSLSWNQTRV